MKNNAFKKLMVLTMIISIFFYNGIIVTAKQEIKNIIYMIPDGGGMAPFFLADYVKQEGGLDEKYPVATPSNAEEMYIKDYLVGAETTHSANNSVTDSAASGTALSSGYKTNNQMIGITPEKKPRVNILEVCQELGKNTGIVITYEWTNATPAAFSAHAESRYDTLIMAEQIVNQGIDVVFGKTISDYESQSWFTDKAFENSGYKVIKNKSQLSKVVPGNRLWGKLPPSYMDYKKSPDAPHLSELTAAAIKALDDGNGFFLMVEGSAVDSGGHSSNASDMVSEWIAFDEACKVAIEYAKKRNDTVVVIAPDHDTGGMKYGNNYASTSLKHLTTDIRNGNNPSGITWEGKGGHTGRNGGVFMYLPEGTAYPAGIDKTKAGDVLKAFENNFTACSVNRIDNTDITKYLAGLLGADLDDMTDKLFVDITNKGSYNSETGKFTFTTDKGSNIEIKRNTSVAEINGKNISLDGRVAVYLGQKFYVPQILLDLIEEEEYTVPSDNITIEKDGKTLENISEIKSGDTIRFAIKDYKPTIVIAILAQYDANNKLINARTVPAGTDNYIRVTVKDNVRTIKAFYLSKLMCAPFAEASIVD